MNICRCSLVLISCFTLFVSARDVFAQPKTTQATFVDLNDAPAEKVFVAGVEFRGRKTAPTKFTTCDGQVIDIGNKTPVPAGPCPHDEKARRISTFVGTVTEVRSADSQVGFKGKDGKTYFVYLPSDAKEIIGDDFTEYSTMNLLLKSSSSNPVRVKSLNANTLSPGKTLVFVSLTPGRIEAIAKAN